MLTFDDLEELKDNESARKAFVLKAIDEHKGSRTYKIARNAGLYSRHLNVTIMKYQKLLYTMSGTAVPDNYTANHNGGLPRSAVESVLRPFGTMWQNDIPRPTKRL